MPISITCSKCRSIFNVAESMAGKVLKCRTCGGAIRVNDPDVVDDVRVVELARSRPLAAELPRPRLVRRKRKSSSGSQAVVIIASIVGGLMLLAGVGCVGLYFLGRSVQEGGWPTRRGSVAAASMGTQIATLSNLRATTGFAGREAYAVDVSLSSEPAIAIGYHLVLSQDGAKGEVRFSAMDLKQGTISVERLFHSYGGPKGRRGTISAWLESLGAGNGLERQRVSNIVTLN